MTTAAPWHLHRALTPIVGQHLTMTFFNLTLNGTVVRAAGDRLTLHVDSRATCLVLKSGWEMSTTYALAHGVIDARFVVTKAHGHEVHLQRLGSAQVQQRRRTPRITAFVPVLMIRHRPEWLHPAHAWATTVNLSLGGARLRLHDSAEGVPDELEVVDVRLSLPLESVAATATVLVVSADVTRIRFLEMDDHDATRLADFIDAGLRQPHRADDVTTTPGAR